MSDTAQLGYLTVAKQTAKGTAGSSADLIANGLLATAFDLGVESPVEWADPEVDGTRDPRAGSPRFGGAHVSGGIDAYLRYAVLPVLLQGFGFTFAAPVLVETGVYKHTGTLVNVPSWLTVESSYGANRLVRRFVDCLVDTLTLGVEADGDATLHADLVGITETVQASPTAVTYPASDARGSWTGSAVTLGGLGTYRWASLELALENALSSDEYVVGSRVLDDVTPGERSVVLSGTIRVGNNTPDVMALYRAAAYGDPIATTPGVLEPYATSAAVTFGSAKKIGASTVERYRAVVNLPAVVLSAFPLPSSGADVLTVDLEARATGSGMTVDVYNARATAY